MTIPWQLPRGRFRIAEMPPEVGKFEGSIPFFVD